MDRDIIGLLYGRKRLTVCYLHPNGCAKRFHVVDRLCCDRPTFKSFTNKPFKILLGGSKDDFG